MKMNQTEITVAAHYIINRVNLINNGMIGGGLSVPSVSMRDQIAFDDNGWEIHFDNSVITKDGEVQYKIVKKYGKGGKMLKPTLRYVGERK